MTFNFCIGLGFFQNSQSTPIMNICQLSEFLFSVSTVRPNYHGQSFYQLVYRPSVRSKLVNSISMHNCTCFFWTAEYTVSQKTRHPIVTLISSNVSRFSEFFHRW